MSCDLCCCCLLPDWIGEEGDEIGENFLAADAANDMLDLIASYSEFHEVLAQLLQEKNLEGYTPFMAAVVFKVQ